MALTKTVNIDGNLMPRSHLRMIWIDFDGIVFQLLSAVVSYYFFELKSAPKAVTSVRAYPSFLPRLQ